MIKFLRIFIFALLTVSSICLQASEDLPLYSTVYDPARDAGDDAVAALALAKRTNRMVLIEVGGDWCAWCHILDRFIRSHPKVGHRLYETFVVLKVNVSEDNDNAEFMASMPPVLGYPHMYISDADGNILHSQDTADFLYDNRYSEQRFMDFFDRWQIDDDGK
jgi:thiol:disulfide interchange protein